MKPRIILIGAGGHGKVLVDTIILQGKYEIVGFVDSSLAVDTEIYRKFKVILAQNELNKMSNFADYFIITIGNNIIRERLFKEAENYLKPALIIHPSATIGSDVTIGDGSVVLSNSIINTCSYIGKNTIVNSGVIIDHECKIGSHVHLSIGSLVGSNSIISDNTTTDIGQHINSFSKI
ncbi:MAG: hypothetical protein ACOYO1_17000 [Bacteroidales bacterium]